jgi:hypothetical protein
VVRWLSASLMLLTCLFLAGSRVIQSELPPVSCSDNASGWVRMVGYDSNQGAVHALAQGVAHPSPVVAASAYDLQLARRHAGTVPRSASGSRTDQSQTYLRTARLRL